MTIFGICTLLLLHQVPSDITVIKEQLSAAPYQTTGTVKAASIHRTCPYNIVTEVRDCHYIKASQENLKLLVDFDDLESYSIEEAAEIIMRSQPRAIVQRCISHRPIPPPLWAQLPTDTVINKIFGKLPDIFLFSYDGMARCSCGNSMYAAGIHPVITRRFIVYGSIMATEHAI